MIDHRAVAEPLGHSAHVDGDSPFLIGLKFDIHRLTGMQTARDLRVEDRFDHEDEFRAALPAVDDRRGVFRVRRDETDLADEGFGTPSTITRVVSP